MSAAAPPSTRRALTLAFGLYLLWVLATYLLEGRIHTLLRPEAMSARLFYALVANILIGIGGSALVIRFLSRAGTVSTEQAGFRGQTASNGARLALSTSRAQCTSRGRRDREMVLGRRPVVVCALVALLALVVGVVGTVSASPDGDKERNKAHTTLKVLAKDREARVVDLGPHGPSQGDMRVVNGPLYNASGTEKVGRLDLFCVLTDPADKPGETAQTTQCSYTFTLPGGEISAQGVTLRPELSGSSTDDFVALSGGTGRHVGVQGEVHFRTRGDKVSIAFHFVR